MSESSATSTARPARGWEGIVSRLNATEDIAEFHRGVLDLQCKIVAAEYGALWVMDQQGSPQAAAIWPERITNTPADSPVMQVMVEAARNGFSQQNSHVLKVEPEGEAGAESRPPTGPGPHVFVTVFRIQGRVAAISTVVADCRDTQVIQSTAPLRELSAGLYENFFSKRDAAERSAEVQRVRRAVAILAVSQEAEGFRGANLNLVNELARHFKCTRVSMGRIRGHHVKLAAMSDTEELKRHSEAAAHLELAMAECLDQQQPIVYPVPDDAEPVLAEAIVHAHRRLTGQQVGRHVASVPLRVRDEWIGVISLERADEPFAAEDVAHFQLIADVVAPHLLDRYHADRWVSTHAWHSVRRGASYLVGPKHVAWKMVGVLVAAVLLFVVFGSWEYRVSAKFTLEAWAKRVIPAPYEGELERVWVEPGTAVKAGQALASLDAKQLQLELAESRGRLKVVTAQYDKAQADGATADARQAHAGMDQVQANIELLEYKVAQSVIRSPLDGVVLSGTWKDKVGGVVPMGEPMFEVAPLLDLLATARISEADIDQVRRHMETREEPLAGRLATRSEPQQKFRFIVARIVPVAVPFEGGNVFEVRAQFRDDPWTEQARFEAGDTTVYQRQRFRAVAASGPETRRGAVEPGKDPNVWMPAHWLRPGMEGIAKIDAGPRRVAWIIGHRFADKLRLWLWW